MNGNLRPLNRNTWLQLAVCNLAHVASDKEWFRVFIPRRRAKLSCVSAPTPPFVLFHCFAGSTVACIDLSMYVIYTDLKA